MVNNLGNQANSAGSGVASLTGGVQNLGRYSGNSTSAMASLSGGVTGISSAAGSASRNIQNLNSNISGTGGAANSSANGINNLNSRLGDTHRSATSASGALNSLKGLMAGMAGAFSLGKAISEMASFETKMLSLKSLTNASTEDMKKMEMQSRQLGATTAFSAQQAAEAQGVLASAGLKTNEILLATPKVLELASAGNLDLAKAAEYAMGAIKGFGLELTDMGHVNNVFAQVAKDSSTSVGEVGEAMKAAAPMAKSFGITIDSTSAAIGVLANGQIKGAEAGNALKSMLSALGSETKSKIEILKQHGLTYKDLSVEVNGLGKVLGTIRNAGFTGAEGLELFGADAAAATLVLANGTDTFLEFEKSNRNVGETAKEMSDILNQGLSKAWDALGGVMSEAALQMGETTTGSDSLIGSLTSMVQTATGVISIYEGMGQQFKESNNLSEEQYQHLQDIANGLLIVGGAVGGIAALASGIWLMNAAMVAFEATLVLVSAHPIIAFAALIAAALGAAYGTVKAWDKDIDGQITHAETRIRNFNKEGFVGGALRTVGSVLGYDIKDEEANLAQLRALKIQKDKLAATPVVADPIESMTGFKKVAAQKLKNLKEYQQEMILETAKLKGIDANLIKAVISVESAFKPESTSPVGAIGLMQIMPANAKSLNTTAEALKNEATNIEKGTEFLAKQLKASGGRLDEAWASWNWGSGNVKKSKDANGGVFSMNNVGVPAETRKSYEELIATLGFYGTTIANVERPTRAAAAATAELEKSNAKLALTAQKEKEKAYDNTAAGAFDKGLKELNASFAEGSRDSYEYNSKFDALLATYNKATGVIQGVSASQKELNGLLAGTPQFELDSTMNKLNAQKSAGLINDYYYNTNATKAQNQFSVQTTGVDPSAEANKKATESGNDAKASMQAAEQATKAYETAIKSAGKATFDAGNTASALFDSMNGGIGKLVGAFDNLSASIQAHSKQFEGITETYQQNLKIEGLSAEQQANLTKLYYDDKQSYQDAMQLSTLSGIRQIAGASSKMMKEESVGRRALHSLEVTLSTIEIAMSVKKTAVKLAEGAAEMFAQSGWAGFAGVAAMIAVVAGLGYFGASGGSSTKPPDFTKTTGTVLGDSAKQSESIKSVTDKLNEIHLSELPELKNIVGAVRSLSEAQSALLINMFRAGGVKLQTVDGASQVSSLGKLLVGGITGTLLSKIPVIGSIIGGAINWLAGGLFGKKSSSVTGGGVDFGSQSLGSVIDNGAVAGNTRTDITTVKSSWFTKKTSYSSVTSPLDKAISDGMGQVFESMGSAVMEFWNLLGFDNVKGMEKMRSFVVSGSIDTFNKTDAEIQTAFDNFTSLNFDNLVTSMFGEFITQFQKLGETLSETMSRVIAESGAAKVAFANMGVSMAASTAAAIVFSQHMIKVAGSIKELVSLVDNFASKFAGTSTKLLSGIEVIKNFTQDTNNIIALSKVTDGNSMSAITNIVDKITKNGDVSAASISSLRDEIAKTGVALLNKTKDLTAGTVDKNGAAIVNPIPATGEAANLLSMMDNASIGILQITDALDLLLTTIAERQKVVNGIVEDILKTTTNSYQTAERAQAAALALLKNDTTLYTFNNKDNYEMSRQIKLNNAALELNATFDSLTSTWAISAEGLQKLSYSIQQTAKSSAGMATALTTLMDAQLSITAWAAKQTSETTGNKQTQLADTKKLFDKQLIDAQSSNPKIAEKALAGITSTADSYISSIKGFYASTQAGQDLIKGVIDKVTALPQKLTVFDLMLERLVNIENGIYGIPRGMSAEAGINMQNLVDAIEAARLKAKDNPTATAFDGFALDKLAGLMLSLESAQNNGLKGDKYEQMVASVAGTAGAISADRLALGATGISDTLKLGITDGMQSAIDTLQPLIKAMTAAPNDAAKQTAFDDQLKAVDAYAQNVMHLLLQTPALTEAQIKAAIDAMALKFQSDPAALTADTKANIPPSVINDSFHLGAQIMTPTPVALLKAVNDISSGLADAKAAIEAIKLEFTPIPELALVKLIAANGITEVIDKVTLELDALDKKLPTYVTVKVDDKSMVDLNAISTALALINALVKPLILSATDDTKTAIDSATAAMKKINLLFANDLVITATDLASPKLIAVTELVGKLTSGTVNVDFVITGLTDAIVANIVELGKLLAAVPASKIIGNITTTSTVKADLITAETNLVASVSVAKKYVIGIVTVNTGTVLTDIDTVQKAIDKIASTGGTLLIHATMSTTNITETVADIDKIMAFVNSTDAVSKIDKLVTDSVASLDKLPSAAAKNAFSIVATDAATSVIADIQKKIEDFAAKPSTAVTLIASDLVSPALQNITNLINAISNTSLTINADDKSAAVVRAASDAFAALGQINPTITISISDLATPKADALITKLAGIVDKNVTLNMTVNGLPTTITDALTNIKNITATSTSVATLKATNTVADDIIAAMLLVNAAVTGATNHVISILSVDTLGAATSLNELIVKIDAVVAAGSNIVVKVTVTSTGLTEAAAAITTIGMHTSYAIAITATQTAVPVFQQVIDIAKVLADKKVTISGTCSITGLGDTATVATALFQALDTLTQYIDGKSRIIDGLTAIAGAMKLIGDNVGYISDLPTKIVAALRGLDSSFTTPKTYTVAVLAVDTTAAAQTLATLNQSLVSIANNSSIRISGVASVTGLADVNLIMSNLGEFAKTGIKITAIDELSPQLAIIKALFADVKSAAAHPVTVSGSISISGLDTLKNVAAPLNDVLTSLTSNLMMSTLGLVSLKIKAIGDESSLATKNVASFVDALSNKAQSLLPANTPLPPDIIAISKAIKDVADSITGLGSDAGKSGGTISAFFDSFSNSSTLSSTIVALSGSIAKIGSSMRATIQDVKDYMAALKSTQVTDKSIGLTSSVDTTAGTIKTLTSDGVSLAAATKIVAAQSKAEIANQKLVDSAAITSAADASKYKTYKATNKTSLIEPISTLPVINSMAMNESETATAATAVAKAKLLKNEILGGGAIGKLLGYLRGYNETHPDAQISDAIFESLAPIKSDAASYTTGAITSKVSSLSPAATRDSMNLIAKKAAMTKLQEIDDYMNQPTSELNAYYSFLSNWNELNPDMMFASGGAFTNGVVDRPTSFNMGLMGEAGSEAIFPLHNIDGSLGVRAILPAANDSSNDNAETISELKESNRQLGAVITVLQGKLDQILQENRKQTDALDSMQSTARVNSKVAAKR